jgi:hypothetical protein
MVWCVSVSLLAQYAWKLVSSLLVRACEILAELEQACGVHAFRS